MIEQLARETGFISRSTSRLSGKAFLKMLSTHIASPEQWSLNDQCHYLQEEFGIAMSKHSLDERYHTFAVRFLKSCYELILAWHRPHRTKPLAWRLIFLTSISPVPLLFSCLLTWPPPQG